VSGERRVGEREKSSWEDRKGKREGMQKGSKGKEENGSLEGQRNRR